MRALLIALAMSLSATGSVADIAWKVDRFVAGSTMVMKGRSGALTHVKRSAQNGVHVFDVHAGTTPQGAFIGRYVTNNRGEVVQTVSADGAVTRFVPHRCSRTVGTCQFTMIHPDGYREVRSRVTEATRGGLRYQEFGLDGLMSEGALRLDANGASTGGWTRNNSGGQAKTRTRRMSIAMN